MSNKRIAIINGPNLNLVGVREPEIYGEMSFDEYIPHLRGLYSDIDISYFQSNHEGALIDELQRIGFENPVQADGIILNAGGLTHTSICLADTVKGIISPVVEVHISDIHQREDFRKQSYLTAPCIHTIMGKGLAGYQEAIEYLSDEIFTL